MKLIKILFILILPIHSFGQTQILSDTTYRSTNLKISYNSSIIYPGLRFGMEFPVISKEISKIKKSGITKSFVKDRFISANFGLYHQKGFHTNSYLTAGWTIRRTKSSGFFSEFSPEIGISRTFLAGTTYVVEDNGNVTRKKLAGYFYPLLSVGGGFGYDFSKKHSKPLLLFTKANLIIMLPYNSTYYIRPIVEIGVIYKPQNFLRIKTKVKSIKK